MNRQTLLLSGLVVVLVVAVWFFFLFQPKQDEVAEIEEEIVGTEQQIVTTQRRIRQLQDVRERAPAIESQLVAAESVIPADPALPAMVRQLQLAADESGVSLTSISPGRPSAVGGDAGDLAQLSLSLSLEGGYFQVVDFLRRLEDPTIVARGILVEGATLSPSEYPTLAVSLSARMFARLTVPAAPAPAEDGDTADGGDGGAAPPEGGAEVDVDEPTEDATVPPTEDATDAEPAEDEQ